MWTATMIRTMMRMMEMSRRSRRAVIPTVYQQQKGMYDSHTHVCANRIVSLEQSHVRPIQRGKRPNPTEFGQKLHLSVVDGYTYLEQTSWSNFNEGCDLETCRYTQNYEGTQVLMEGDNLGFAPLAKELSNVSGNPVMLLYIYDGDFWGYDFYGGDEEDHFSTWPDYFGPVSP